MWGLQLGFCVCSLCVFYLGVCVGAQTFLIVGLKSRGFTVLLLRPTVELAAFSALLIHYARFLHCLVSRGMWMVETHGEANFEELDFIGCLLIVVFMQHSQRRRCVGHVTLGEQRQCCKAASRQWRWDKDESG